MSLIELLNEDMIKAMKSQSKKELSVIRMVKAAMQLEKINKQRELTDDDVLDIVNKQVKLCNDAIAEFKKANRNDLVEESELEIVILNKYLPEQLTDEELDKIIDSVIQSKQGLDFGSLMKETIPMVKGKADLSKVSSIIRQKI